MDLSLAFYIAFALFTVVVAAVLAFYTWRRGVFPGAVPLALILVGVAWWQMCYMFQVLSGANLGGQIWWATLRYLGSFGFAPLLLTFALQFTGRSRWLSRPVRLAMWLPPLIGLALLLTNEAHRLFWTDRWLARNGPLTYLFVERGTLAWAYTAFGFLLVSLAASLLLHWVAAHPHSLLDLAPVAGSLVIQETSDAIVVVNMQGRIVSINPAARRMVGALSGSSLIGLSAAQVFSAWPDLLERFWDVAEAQAEITLGEAAAMQTFDLRISPLTDQRGKQIGRLVTARDITARKLAEEQLRLQSAALQAAANGIVITNRNGEILWTNPAFTRLTGYTAVEARGQNMRLLKSGAHDPAFYQSIWNTALAGNIWHGQIINRRKDGLLYTEETTIAPVRDDDGKITHFVDIKQDVTVRMQAEAELRTQKDLFENLVTVARAASEQPELEGRLRSTLDVLAAFVAAEASELFLLNDRGAVVDGILAYGAVTPPPWQGLAQARLDKGLFGWVVRQRQSALILDTLQDDRWLAAPDLPFPVRSVLSVPILRGPALVGVFTFLHPQPDHFGNFHLRLVEAATDQIALALHNAQIYDAQRRMTSRQITLHGVLGAVGSQIDPQAVVRLALEAIVELSGWPNLTINLPTEDGRHLTVAAGTGVLASLVGKTFSTDEGIVGRVFTTRKPQRVPDVQADPDYIAVHPSIRSEIAVPLLREDRLLGVIDVESEQPNAFDIHDSLLAEALADAVALALDNAYLHLSVESQRSRLDALIKSSSDGVVIVGKRGLLQVVNAAALRLLGLPGQPEDWRARPIVEAVNALRYRAPAVIRTTLAELRRVQRGDEAASDGKYEIGSYAIHWFSLPVLSGAASLGRLLILHDVTQEQRLGKMRDDLTHTMVHDLRNPLTIIQMSLETFAQITTAPLSIDAQGFLVMATRNSARLLKMVNAILDISRLESGQMPLQFERTTLPLLIRETLQWQTPLIEAREIHIENNVPVDLPPVKIDQSMILRVLQNLVDNAVKFTPEKGSISLGAEYTNGAVRLITVSVCNTGPGIAPELKERLFEKFVTGQQEGSGSGLGLAYCRMVVEAHGGELWVESVPDRETVFYFTLPVVE